MATLTRLQLSIMMFLEFFVWGAWFVTMGSYLAATLDASGAQTAMAYSTQSWGAIIAPFIVGLIADRYFNAERVLAILHFAGAALMYLLYRTQGFDEFYPYLLVYMIVYMPTLALANAIAFRAMKNPARDFAKIRVWGTVGWIAAGLAISYVFSWDSQSAVRSGLLENTFLMASAASLVLGAWSLTLPRTPPQAASGGRQRFGQMLGLDALELLRDRNFLTFFVCSILICIPLAFYYQCANQFLTQIGVENATGKQTLGQVSEVLFMLALPFFLHRLGMKVTLLIGMLAWTVRYVLFAAGDAGDLVPLLIVGIALHGVCYDFFFVSGQIYTDSRAGERHKSAAQGLITLATYGVGMFIGFYFAGVITDQYAAAGPQGWRIVWLYPAAFALVVSAAFALCFRNVSISYERQLAGASSGTEPRRVAATSPEA